MNFFKLRQEKTEQEKLEERRARILARANKFRYPMQFSRRRLLIATIVIGVVSSAALCGVLLWSIYVGQNDGDMVFRIARFVPLPVAEIDGEPVRFSDYMMIYRSSLAPIEHQTGKIGNDSSAEEMKTYYKRSALTGAEDLSFALKLAKENSIVVSEEDINSKWEEQKNIGGTVRSEASFLKVLKDNFGLSREEYRRILFLNLIKVKVTQLIDKEAEQSVKQVEKMLAVNGGDLHKIVDELKEKVNYEETGGMVSNLNVDGGRASVAMGLQVGQISKQLLAANGEGYYFVKLIEKNEKQVNYASLKIPFREFDKKLNEIRARGAVKEYIKL